MTSLGRPAPIFIQLRSLNVGHNRLERLPGSLGLLINLVHLDVSGNELMDTGLPRVMFSSAMALERLFISDNKLQRIGSAIGELVNLKILAARYFISPNQ